MDKQLIVNKKVNQFKPIKIGRFFDLRLIERQVFVQNEKLPLRNLEKLSLNESEFLNGKKVKCDFIIYPNN